MTEFALLLRLATTTCYYDLLLVDRSWEFDVDLCSVGVRIAVRTVFVRAVVMISEGGQNRVR